MSRESLAVVETDSEPFETKGEIQRTSDGRFTEGTCGGPGGSRPGSGRKPAPADETLLKRLYDLLDQNADKALQVLVDQLEHKDPKIQQKAAAILLSKTLPETRFLKSWEGKGEGLAEEAEWFKELLDLKREKDLAELEQKEMDPQGAEKTTEGGDNEKCR